MNALSWVKDFNKTNTLTALVANEAQKEARRKAKLRRQARRDLEKELRREANLYKNAIIDAFTQQELVKRVKYENMYGRPAEEGSRRHRRPKIRKMQIAEICYNHDAIFFRIDTHSRKLPSGVTIEDIRSPDTLEAIGYNCHRTVRYVGSPECGAWIILEREGASYRIPKKFLYKTALEKMEETNPALPPLAICVGAAQDGEIVIGDLQKWKNLLVAGEVGSGKSVFLNQGLVTLAWRNDPDTVRFALVDLKDGQELGDYDPLPHMIKPVAKTPEEAIELLKYLREFLQARGKLMAKRRIRNIEEWNRLYPKEKMFFVVCVIDELAELLKGYRKELREEGETLLGELLSQSRARGGYFILCTQSPRREVVAGLIKANAPVRLAFAVASRVESNIIIGSGAAWQLEPVGRAAFREGARLIVVQAPYLSSGKIYGAIKTIQRRGGRIGVKRSEVGVTEILEWALKNTPSPRGAKLSWPKLYDAFKSRGISQNWIRELLETIEEREFEVYSLNYKIIHNPHNGGPTGGREMIRWENGAAYRELPTSESVEKSNQEISA